MHEYIVWREKCIVLVTRTQPVHGCTNGRPRAHTRTHQRRRPRPRAQSTGTTKFHAHFAQQRTDTQARGRHMHTHPPTHPPTHTHTHHLNAHPSTHPPTQPARTVVPPSPPTSELASTVLYVLYMRTVPWYVDVCDCTTHARGHNVVPLKVFVPCAHQPELLRCHPVGRVRMQKVEHGRRVRCHLACLRRGGPARRGWWAPRAGRQSAVRQKVHGPARTQYCVMRRHERTDGRTHGRTEWVDGWMDGMKPPTGWQGRVHVHEW